MLERLVQLLGQHGNAMVVEWSASLIYSLASNVESIASRLAGKPMPLRA